MTNQVNNVIIYDPFGCFKFSTHKSATKVQNTKDQSLHFEILLWCKCVKNEFSTSLAKLLTWTCYFNF